MNKVPEYDAVALGIKDYIVEVSAEKRDNLLAGWRWLVGGVSELLFVTKFGCAFVYRSDCDAVWFLDPNNDWGFNCFHSAQKFERTIVREPLRDEYLSVGVVDDFVGQGMVLGKDQVYSMVAPFYLGGEAIASNVQMIDVDVHFGVAAQLYQQTHPKEMFHEVDMNTYSHAR